MTPNEPGTPNDSPNWPPDWREMRRRRWEERRQRRQRRVEEGILFHSDTGGGRLFFGTIVLLLGILFLLQNLGIFYVARLWQFWPVILIALGIGRLVDARDWHRKLWGGTLAGIGAIFLVNNLGYLPWNVWSVLWPAWLIFWGIVILARGFGRQGS